MNRKKEAVLVITFLTAVMFTACGGSKTSDARIEETYAASAKAYDYAMYEESGAEIPMATEAAAGLGYTENGTAVSEAELLGSNTEKTGVTERKLIRNINVCLETEKFEPVKANIKKNIETLGGYIENSSEYLGGYYSNSNRNAYITARIPADTTDQFLNTSFSDAFITSMDENTEDVSLRYSDLQTKLKTLEAERDRLMELIKEAEDVDSIIALEARLSEIRYELESIQSNLKSYDNRVSYSTVWISINEVKRVEASVKASFGERVASGFRSSSEALFEGIQDFAVWFISNILSIILVAGIGTGLVLLIIKIFKKRMYEKKNRESGQKNNENKN